MSVRTTVEVQDGRFANPQAASTSPIPPCVDQARRPSSPAEELPDLATLSLDDMSVRPAQERPRSDVVWSTLEVQDALDGAAPGPSAPQTSRDRGVTSPSVNVEPRFTDATPPADPPSSSASYTSVKGSPSVAGISATVSFSRHQATDAPPQLKDVGFHGELKPYQAVDLERLVKRDEEINRAWAQDAQPGAFVGRLLGYILAFAPGYATSTTIQITHVLIITARLGKTVVSIGLIFKSLAIARSGNMPTL